MKPNPFLVANGGDELEDALASGELAPMAVLRFDRHEIERRNTHAALMRLRTFSGSAKAVSMMANAAWLEVQGYDTDTREVFEIPECRQFFQTLAEEWDGWFHFLEKRGDSFRLFFALLVDVSVARRGALVTNFYFSDIDQFGRVLRHQFELMNRLYLQHNLSDEACRTMTGNVLAAIKRMAQHQI